MLHANIIIIFCISLFSQYKIRLKISDHPYKSQILVISKRISASFLINTFCCILNYKFDFHVRVVQNFQSDLILPNDNFETFLFNKKYPRIIFGTFYKLKHFILHNWHILLASYEFFFYSTKIVYLS